jgi:DNA primase
MKTQSEIQALKQISIIGFLRYRGIIPIKINGGEYWYLSLLRNENTASLSVNLSKNVFKDFGDDSSKGSIIDLVMMLDKISFIQACQVLEEYDGKKEKEVLENSFSLSCQTSESTIQDYQITAVKDLQHPALLRYVESRKISFQNAYRYLREIHYTNAKGKFFGAGYQTESGGYVVRSEIMKKPINLGKAGIKIFAVPNSKNVAVFEGMFDFLSACEFYKGCPTMTAIILNSTSNVNKALPSIKQYEKVFCYLDNDDAGYKALDKLKQAGANVFDCSHVYKPFNDFNFFLTI